MSAPITFALYDFAGQPLVDALPVLQLYVDAEGTPAAAPPVVNLGGGLYSFLPTAEDELAGRAYVLDGGAAAAARLQVGGVGTLKVLATYDADGALASSATLPAFASYVSAANGAPLAQPAIVLLAPGLYGFQPPAADFLAGVAYEIETYAEPPRLFGSITAAELDLGSGAAPVVTNLAPPLDTVLDHAQAVQLDVVVPGGLLREAIVLVRYPAPGLTEIAYDGRAFAPAYAAANSYAINVAGGVRLQLQRAGGWPAAPVLVVHANSAAGVPNLPEQYAWRLQEQPPVVLPEEGSAPAPGADVVRNLAVDEQGRLVLERGNLKLARGRDAILQSIRTRLRLFQGEWFLDVDEGTPHKQVVLKKNPDMLAVRAAYRSRILGTPGVAQLNSLELHVDPATRVLSVSFRVTADTGELVPSSGTEVVRL